MLFKRTAFYRVILGCFIAQLWALSPAYGEGWDIVENCDMPAASLRDLKTDSREECQQHCSESMDCQGIIYISGWKKCQLKADVKKRAKLRFLSGELDDKHAYQLGSFKVDQDHSGKDLQRLVLDQADKCGQACEARVDCAAFTFLEGYRVCWLKKAGGKLSSKVFSCSFKKN